LVATKTKKSPFSFTVCYRMDQRTQKLTHISRQMSIRKRSSQTARNPLLIFHPWKISSSSYNINLQSYYFTSAQIKPSYRLPVARFIRLLFQLKAGYSAAAMESIIPLAQEIGPLITNSNKLKLKCRGKLTK
jgi:hypothetical protein